MANILNEIAQKTKIRVEKLKKNKPLEQVKESAMKVCQTENTNGIKYPFEQALKKSGISFICEVKKASPSKGLIAPDFPYLRIAKEYEEAGAAAVSVLTEPEYFMGSEKYLQEIANEVSIPVLRKDFTVDEYQIYEAKIIGASAVLLICAILDNEQIKKFIKIAHELGLSALVEAHDETEVNRAIQCGARVIGVNNRDLKTFTVDINNSINLRKKVPQNILFISESGIKTHKDIQALVDNGTDGVLIGETFMRSKNKVTMLNELRNGKNTVCDTRTKIKICGLKREEDIDYVNELMPDYVGFVFAKSKRMIDKEMSKILKSKLSDNIKTVGVFVNEKEEIVANLVNENIIDLVQLHGDEDNHYIDRLKKLVDKNSTRWQIIKAFKIRNEEDVAIAETSNADYLLFDTYSEHSEGGTGSTFDWTMIETVKRPYFLAGGLNEKNVASAIKRLHPYGVDASSSLETDGIKDKDKIKHFMEEAIK